MAELGCPAVLKTAAFGYDGKGQFSIESRRTQIGRGLGLRLARRKRCSRRSSISSARFPWWRRAARTAQFVHYGAIENQHSRHHSGRLRLRRRAFRTKVAREAVEIARCVLEKLDVVGVLCVEFFVTRDGALADQ